MLLGFDVKCRRYFFIACIIFGVNILLVYNLVSLKVDKNALHEDPSGRGHEDDVDPGDHVFIKEKQLHIDKEKRLLRLKEQNRKAHLSNKKLTTSVKTSPPPLRASELEFTPACNVTTKEALSAIRRASTQACKKQIIDVVCASQSGTLYPAHLKSSCPSNGFTFGKALGCFQDDASLRLLTGYFINLEKANSPVNCSNLCLQSGFPYAGVEYWTECFCGNERPPPSAHISDTFCNMKCPSDPNLTCGGYLAINVFETGIVKFIPQTALTEPDKKNDSRRVRIAFLLTFSGRALRQIKRLLKAIYHKDHYYLIHVDVRQDYLFRELLYLEKFISNIRVMRTRQATMWAGTSLLSLLLAAMKELLSIPYWDFVINLSESDFPIKTNDQLVSFLTANRNRNFVKSTGREIERFIQKQGLDKTFVECDGHMWRVGDRILPSGIQMDGGSDWMALSRPFVEYVTADYRNEILLGLDKIYKHTLLPAESFFHVVLRNTEFCDSYVDNNLHLTNWKRHLGCRCQYKHIVDWCGCSPNDFTLDDWPRILATSSSNLFFARKFEPVINQAVINKLELWIAESSPQGKVINANVAGWLSYWQSLYHRSDLSPQRSDGILLVGVSLARLAGRILLNVPITDLLINDTSVFELTSYYHDDIFQGVLVNFFLNSKSQFEAWFKIPSQFSPVESDKNIFLKDLYVTSDFDLKEQTSRSLQGIINPLFPLNVVYKTIINEATNVTFLLEDSSGRLAYVLDVRLENKDQSKPTVGSSKIPLATPLVPGIWLLYAYHDGFLIASTKFLVVPLNTLNGHALVNGEQTGFVHKSVGKYPIPPDKEHWSAALKSSDNILRDHQDQDLPKWSDGLLSRFFTHVATCHLMTDNTIVSSPEDCRNTVWSSAAPDPKSQIVSYFSVDEQLS